MILVLELLKVIVKQNSMSGRDAVNSRQFEVYVLYKVINGNAYIPGREVSHHICLLKCMKTNKFYYSELQTDSGDKSGKIAIKLEEYKFLKGNIHYDFAGYTCKTYDEIENYVNNNTFWCTDYHLLLNNCQHYVIDLLVFLQLEGRAVRGKYPEMAFKPDEIVALDFQETAQLRIMENFCFSD